MKNLLRNILKFGLAIIILAAIVILGISVYAEHKLIYPPREAITVTPKDIGIDYDEVRYETSDGLTIRGWFIPASASANNPNTNDTIILAHGYEHNRAQMNDYMKFLHARGFNVLSFDFRGHGESDGKYTTIGYNEQKDIDGAVTWLKTNHPKEADKIGLLGISMGGATSILATANNKGIDALVTDSAFSKLSNAVDSSFTHFSGFPAFPFSPISMQIAQLETHAQIDEILPIKYIPNIAPRPILIIHSKLDTVILYDKNAIPLYESAGNPKQLWLVECGEHVENLSCSGKEYEDRVNQFFENSLNVKVAANTAVKKPVTKKK